MGRKVPGPGMDHGDRGMMLEQQKGHGFPDDRTAANDDGFFAFEVVTDLLEHPQDTLRGARQKTGVAGQKTAEILRMQAVHVFLRINGLQDPLAIQVWGQRELDQDAVDIVLSIEVLDEL